MNTQYSFVSNWPRWMGRNLFLYALLWVGLLLSPPVLLAQNGPICDAFTNKSTANGIGDNWVYDVYAVGNTIYAATEGGVSISTNGGSTWTNKIVGTFLGERRIHGIYAVAGSPGSTTVYAGSSGGLWISTDGGNSFTKNNTYAMTGLFVVASPVSTTIYAPTASNGLYISTNGGSTWNNKTTANGLGSNVMDGVFAVGNTVYACTAAGLGISTNGGNSFTNITTANGLANDYVVDVYAVGNTIYAATNGGLSISTDGGSTWANTIFLNGLNISQVGDVYAIGNTIYAATSTVGLNISTDGGSTWTRKTTANGLGANGALSVYVVDNNIYVGTVGGISFCSGTAPCPSLTIAATPSNTITAGGSVTLTASSGSPAGATSYTWSTGESTTAITVSNVTSATAFSVTGVTGECSGTATVTVSVTAPPFSFTTDVMPTTLCAGGSVALSASTTQGTAPYSYTWIAPPGGSITGSGSAVTGIVSSTASGVQTFTLQAMDSGSPSLSVTQTVSVTVVGIDITTPPAASSLVCVGASVSVPVSASGAIDSYLWYKDNTPVQGQTSATLSLSPVTLGDAGSYKLVITGSCNSVTTTAFQLTVSETLGITAQPAASSTVCAGVAVSIPASVSGVGATYQWYKDTTAVASQTTSTLSLTNPGGADAGSYSLVATGGCNSVTTSAFSLSVIEVGNFTQQPVSGSAVCVGGSVSVPTTVTGSVASYQWYKGGSPVSGQNTNTLSLTGLGVGDGGVYKLMATMTSCGSVTSSAFSLTVNANPTVTILASPGLAVLPGSSVTLTADGASSYQWSANTDNASGATIVASTTGVYSVTGTANGCTGTASVTLIGLIPPVLSASSSVVCEGSTITVQGITPQTVTYQWLKDGVSMGSSYQSATLTLGGLQPCPATTSVCSPLSATLTLGGLQPAQSGAYELVVTSGGASVTSTGSFSLTVQPLPTVTLYFSGATQSLQGGNLPIITLTKPLDPANLPVFQVLGGAQYERLQQVDRLNGYEIRKSQINGTGVFTIDLLGPYSVTVTGENGCQRTVTGVIKN